MTPKRLDPNISKTAGDALCSNSR